MIDNNTVPLLVRVPEGPSMLGSRLVDPFRGDRDQPCIEIYLSEFFIGKYPVTNREYLYFIESTNYLAPKHWTSKLRGGRAVFPNELENHPVVSISWNDANNYALWLSSKLGHSFSLPTEAEWEKAARGPDGKIWPWGDDFAIGNCNSAESDLSTTCPVELFSSGVSDYGCTHMVGNTWEWCLDFYDPFGHQYAGRVNPVNTTPSRQRVVKGGSYYYDKSICRPAGRDYINQNNEGGGDDGFRIALRKQNVNGNKLIVL